MTDAVTTKPLPIAAALGRMLNIPYFLHTVLAWFPEFSALRGNSENHLRIFFYPMRIGPWAGRVPRGSALCPHPSARAARRWRARALRGAQPPRIASRRYALGKRPRRAKRAAEGRLVGEAAALLR